jgi:signal transduction histidine kinase
VKRKSASKLAWTLAALAAVALLVGEALWIAMGGASEQLFFAILLPLFVIAFGVVGALVATRQPGNPIGWIFVGVALLWGLASGGSGVAEYARARHWSISEPLLIADWLGAWIFIPGIYVPITFLFLLFPDGHLPSRRWLPISWLATVGIGLNTLWSAFAPQGTEDIVLTRSNPYAIGSPGFWNVIQGVSWPLGLLGMLGSVAALVVRYRRSSGEERQQMKWLAYGSVLVAILFIVGGVGFGVVGDNEGAQTAIEALLVFALFLIPVTSAVAILKYRLYDIDVVINKTVVYGALAGFITLVYVGIVVGIGTAIGQGDRPNLGLSILATAVVAVAFQPVRERIQRFANRLVYGKRATPYEVLSHFGERMASTVATEELLPRMAEILAQGTGAARTEVWLKVGPELRRAASWPQKDQDVPKVLPLSADELPLIEDSDRSVPVRHQGEFLGALSVRKTRGEPLTPSDAKLLEDLASQAGLVLRNVKLIEELRASRQRLVAAQDEERQRIERNIHDGAQQQLVALNVKLGLAKTLLRKDTQKTQEMIEQLQQETVDALENLRDLARGIYPPLLADKGLVAALEAQAGKAPVPVDVRADGIGRFAKDSEAAVYFCILEALQNIAKYADASLASIRLDRDGGQLRFQVEDDGRGFDPGAVKPGSGLTNMTDRIEALGGSIEVRSSPSRGTTITGVLPVRALTAVG